MCDRGWGSLPEIENTPKKMAPLDCYERAYLVGEINCQWLNIDTIDSTPCFKQQDRAKCIWTPYQEPTTNTPTSTADDWPVFWWKIRAPPPPFPFVLSLSNPNPNPTKEINVQGLGLLLIISLMICVYGKHPGQLTMTMLSPFLWSKCFSVLLTIFSWEQLVYYIFPLKFLLYLKLSTIPLSQRVKQVC